MSNSVVENVDRMEGYVMALSTVTHVIDEAKHEGKVWCRARCNAILADCRKRFTHQLNCLPEAHSSAWDISFGYVVEMLWATLSPPPGMSDTHLVCRIYKAHGLADLLGTLLSSQVIVASEYPYDPNGENS